MDEKNVKLNTGSSESTKNTTSKLASATGKSELLTQDEVIRRRLVADGDGSGDDRRIQTFLKSFLSFCSSEEFNKAEDELAFRRLMQQLQQLEYSAKRTHAAILMNEDSKRVYSTLQTEISKESERTKKTIQEAKKIIEEETKHRKHSLEYEALCKLIESKPDRKATEERRRELEETSTKYTELRRNLVEAVENRERQVKSLGFAIESLKDGIEDEEMKLWGGSPMAEIVPMDVDAFPLEKDQFPPLTVDPAPVSSVPSQLPPTDEDGPSPNDHQVNSGSSPAKAYEELSEEESPEEGESED